MTAKKKPKGVALEGTAALDELERLDPATAAGVYVVYGKERYLVDRAVTILRDRLLDPRTRDFNYEVFQISGQGKESSAERIVNAARTLPMMAARRVVMVRGLDGMKADEQSRLIPYVEDPSPEAVLVLEGDKLDQRTKLGQALKKLAVCIKLEPLYERHLIGFVRTEAKRRKLVLDTGAGELLCEEIGADLGALADTVERLALWSQAHDGAKVTARDVEAQVPGGRQRTVFELADAVGKGDRARSLAIISSMMDGKESGVRVVAMLARHVRQLWSADGLIKARTPKGELASALGVPPFFVDGIVDQARRVGAGGELAFRALHESLVRADKELKSSRLEEARIMERLVLEMTAGREIARR